MPKIECLGSFGFLALEEDLWEVVVVPLELCGLLAVVTLLGYLVAMVASWWEKGCS